MAVGGAEPPQVGHDEVDLTSKPGGQFAVVAP